ncbi:MAG: LPS-assembly protein LptD [Leptospirillia bacterium]
MPDAPGVKPAEIQLNADHIQYGRDSGRVDAEGRVEIIRGSARLTMDRMAWDRDGGVIHGEGNVRMEDGDSTLDASSVTWNVTDQTGEIVDGRLLLEGRYRLEGAHLRRERADLYTVKDGVFTTCDCPPDQPYSWSVSAKTIRLRPRGTMVARHVRLRIRDVPVLYLPVFLFPTSPRQTGFLVPALSSDTRNGQRVVQPFYWAISPSRDLTVSLDHRTRAGTGGSLWYRYLTAENRGGELRVEGLRDRFDKEINGTVHWRHASRPRHGLRWHADIQTVSDRDYFRTLSEGTEERTAESLESNVYAGRAEGNQATSLLLRRTTDLFSATNAEVQQLPRIRYQAFTRPLGRSPLYVGGHLDGVYLYRQEGSDVIRLDAAPETAVRLPLWGGRATAMARAGARVIWYSDHPGGGATLAEAYPVSATLSTVIHGRLFGTPHTLLPELAWRHVPVSPSKAAAFDRLEQIKDEHEVEVRLRQRIGTVAWRLTGGYDLENKRDLPLRSEVDVPFGAATRWHLDTLHDAGDGLIQRAVADVAFSGRGGLFAVGEVFDRGTVQVGSLFDPGAPSESAPGNRAHFQRARAELGPWGGWRLFGRIDYDQRDNASAEGRYGMAYRSSCWAMEIEYIDLPDRHVVRFRLALLGPGDAPERPPVSTWNAFRDL